MMATAIAAVVGLITLVGGLFGLYKAGGRSQKASQLESDAKVRNEMDRTPSRPAGDRLHDGKF